MIAIPRSSPTDPPLFYMMENKVWNDLYAAFMADPASKQLFQKYQLRPGGEQWFRGEWEKGAHAPGAKPPRHSLGVGEGRGDAPVFRVTATEAHCFAEWLGGRLPRRDQWLKSAGLGEDTRSGPFGDPADVAVNLGREGPWPVSRGNEDVSRGGCRQMAGNGKEWTRTLHDSEQDEIPLQQMNGARPVLVCGQSYAALQPLTFKQMAELDDKSCTENDPEISFRIVLEP
jgi:formylglycine-generating enzyme required for sulfatase activity